jgi:hypothetical protein
MVALAATAVTPEPVVSRVLVEGLPPLVRMARTVLLVTVATPVMAASVEVASTELTAAQTVRTVLLAVTPVTVVTVVSPVRPVPVPVEKQASTATAATPVPLATAAMVLRELSAPMGFLLVIPVPQAVTVVTVATVALVVRVARVSSRVPAPRAAMAATPVSVEMVAAAQPVTPPHSTAVRAATAAIPERLVRAESPWRATVMVVSTARAATVVTVAMDSRLRSPELTAVTAAQLEMAAHSAATAA